MKVFTIIVSLLFCLVLSACSNTSQIAFKTENTHYYAKEFSHNEFTTFNKDSIKKVAVSDQQLMFSLLNRPMPEDQRMMLAFDKSQRSYFPDSTIVGVEIKGDRKSEKDNTRVRSQYAQVIDRDVNAVSISALPK
jgi:hypothetical protein